MSNVRDDLFIDDEEIFEYRRKIESIEKQIEFKLEAFVTMLQRVCDEGITDGDVHDNLQDFVNALSQMRGQFGFVTQTMSSDAEKYIEDVDYNDWSLY